MPEQGGIAEVLVDRPIEDCWDRLRDFSLAHNYVPGLTGTEIVSERRSGVGAHRRVYSGSKYLEESITAWYEGEGFVIRLHRGEKPMPPFRSAEFEYALRAAGEQQTRVQLSMRIEMPWGAFGQLLAKTAILPVMRRQLGQVAAGIKHFYETGEPATDADRKRLAGAVHTGPASL